MNHFDPDWSFKIEVWLLRSCSMLVQDPCDSANKSKWFVLQSNSSSQLHMTKIVHKRSGRISKLCSSNTKSWSAGIHEWYLTQLGSLVHCAMPWAMSLSLGDNKLFLDPSTTSMLSSWFYLVYLFWFYYLSVKFVMWILKQKLENKRNLLKKVTQRVRKVIHGFPIYLEHLP